MKNFGTYIYILQKTLQLYGSKKTKTAVLVINDNKKITKKKCDSRQRTSHMENNFYWKQILLNQYKWSLADRIILIFKTALYNIWVLKTDIKHQLHQRKKR